MCRRPLFVIVLLYLLALLPVSAQTPAPVAGSVVLAIQGGGMRYIREGWQVAVPAQAGTFIGGDDLIFPEEATVLVICPDGSIEEYFAGELFPNDTLTCAVPRENWIVNVDGIQRLNIQRGGRQDPTIPYLISPRGTLVRTNEIELRWNAPLEVRAYRIRIFAGGAEVFPLTSFAPADVEQGEFASTVITLDLQPDTAYTVEICVTFENLRQGCTTDPGWTTGTNLAFYHVANPQLGSQLLAVLEQNIIGQMGADTPESLYARAVLLSQPGNHQRGFNSEALDLINHLLVNFPDHALAQSADVYLRLGNLYREVELPLSAARAFQRSTQVGTTCTDSIAQAYVGLGFTFPDGSRATEFFNQALEHYHCLMQADIFVGQYSNICDMVGDICSDLMAPDQFQG